MFEQDPLKNKNLYQNISYSTGSCPTSLRSSIYLPMFEACGQGYHDFQGLPYPLRTSLLKRSAE